MAPILMSQATPRGALQKLVTAMRDDLFAPPYTTVQTGRLNDGIALNVIPDYAEVEFEIRNMPNENPS